MKTLPGCRNTRCRRLRRRSRNRKKPCGPPRAAAEDGARAGAPCAPRRLAPRLALGAAGPEGCVDVGIDARPCEPVVACKAEYGARVELQRRAARASSR